MVVQVLLKQSNRLTSNEVQKLTTSVTPSLCEQTNLHKIMTGQI